MFKYIYVVIFFFNILINMSQATEKPYHHITNDKGKTISFRNPEGSPQRDSSFNWSFKVFNQEKKKLDMNVPKNHVIDKKEVLQNLKKYKNSDYIGWIGHATFLIKLGNTTIITDPVFEKNMGPFIFGPKRFVDPAIDLKEIPEISLFLFRHTNLTLRHR